MNNFLFQLVIICTIVTMCLDAPSVLYSQQANFPIVQYQRNGVNNNLGVADISSDFGMRSSGGSRFHRGIDYSLNNGGFLAGDGAVAIEGGQLHEFRMDLDRLRMIIMVLKQ